MTQTPRSTNGPTQTARSNDPMWTYRDPSLAKSLAVGYEVRALDGDIGKVDQCSTEVDQSHIVVDTGPWIFGKKVLLPAGVIERVDVNEKKVFVSRTKDEIKNAPEFDPNRLKEESHRREFGTYYGRRAETTRVYGPRRYAAVSASRRAATTKWGVASRALVTPFRCGSDPTPGVFTSCSRLDPNAPRFEGRDAR